MAAAVTPDSILRDLAALWTSFGQTPDQEAHAVLRACAMTLIVAADQADDAQGIWESIAALMPEHPSRAILIRWGGASLSARAFAQCWMPFGQRRQICCEQVEIAAPEAALPDLPSLLLPLLVPDLPVVLWCRCKHLFTVPEFRGVIEMAQKIVVDSARVPLEAVAAARRAGLPVADLSWTRLSRWREVLARVFEGQVNLERLARVSTVRISHGGAAPPATARYLAGWLLGGIRQAGGGAQARFEAVPEAEPGVLTAVELEGADVAISIRTRSSGCAEIRSGDLVYDTVFPLPTGYLLMREELGIPARDPVFEAVLEEVAGRSPA